MYIDFIMFRFKYNCSNQEPVFLLEKIGGPEGVQKGTLRGSRLRGPHFVLTAIYTDVTFFTIG